MQIEMVVAGLTVDPVNNTPIVILREKDGTRVLPIWIGVVEASAIAFELEKVKLNRPMTHDLLKTCVELLEGRVEQVGITALTDNTYYAKIELRQGQQALSVDARPSDAIALGLRAKAPIVCAEDVLTAAQERQGANPQQEEGGQAPEPVEPPSNQDEQAGPRPLVGSSGQSWEDILANLSPEAFGKYKM